MATESRIGERLRALRGRAGLTQNELSKAAGLTLSSVTQIEQGIVDNPRMTTLVALARALGVSLDELVGLGGSSAGAEEGQP